LRLTVTCMDEKEKIIAMLRPVADAFVAMIGRSCEVAIHDLTMLQSSLVYLAGNVTKRRLGAPITDLVVKSLKREGDDVKDILNYKTTTSDGRILKSSTLFFRNLQGKVTVALCLNLETTDFMNSIRFLESFARFDGQAAPNLDETFASSFTQTIDSLVEQALHEVGKEPSTMSTNERLHFVAMLEEKGTFLIKGAVSHVASLMGVSQFTVYNYLQKIRAGNALRT